MLGPSCPDLEPFRSEIGRRRSESLGPLTGNISHRMADFRQVEAPRPPSGSDQSPDLLAALGRQWLTILLAALIGALLGWGYAAAKQTTYQARSTLLLIPVGNESDPGGGRNRSLDVDTWATVARSTNLLQDVATELGRELGDVRGRTTGNRRADRRRAGADVRRQATGMRRSRERRSYSDQFLAARRNSVNAETVKREAELRQLADDTTAQIDDLTDRSKTRRTRATTRRRLGSPS